MAHGGWAIYQYAPLGMAGDGRLVFADELLRRARDTVAQLIVETLEHTEPEIHHYG